MRLEQCVPARGCREDGSAPGGLAASTSHLGNSPWGHTGPLAPVSEGWPGKGVCGGGLALRCLQQ